MSNPAESQGDHEHLFVVQYARPNYSVWSSPNGIGELEFFTAFRILIDRRRRNQGQIAASVPENLLLEAGYVSPGYDDANLEREILRFTPSSESIRKAPLPRMKASVRSTDAVDEDSFLGASVEAKLYDFDTTRMLGSHAISIAEYVRDAVWERPDLLGHLGNLGRHSVEFAASVAYTVQQAVENNNGST